MLIQNSPLKIEAMNIKKLKNGMALRYNDIPPEALKADTLTITEKTPPVSNRIGF